MKEIKLTQEKVAIVDDEDFEFLNQFKWYPFHCCTHRTLYAVRNGRNGETSIVYMHREIMRPLKKMQVDHVDGNGLNCKKENLRLCTQHENHWNTKPRLSGSSKFKGVCWHKGNKLWLSRIYLDGKAKYLGCFKTEEQAALAYDIAAKNLFGQFARTNFGDSL